MTLRVLLVGMALLGAACHTAHPVALREPAWRVWSAAAFLEARAQHKLILISLQADFCHWCHVMNATTYRDPRVLALLAEHFVVLRADEAERPDLRERYAAWGWPATALLTPDARPIVTLRGHQPAEPFSTLLRELLDKQQRGQALTVEPAPRVAASPAPLEATRELALKQLDDAFDPVAAGWGSPQKYPFAAPVEHAFWRAASHREPVRRERAIASLSGYAQLLDPVAGGMFQYSLQGVWSAPHFEKLTSIQAGAIVNFSEAYRATGDVSWLERAQQTALYALHTLRGDDGTFYASQAADVGHVGSAGYRSGAEYYRLPLAERARVPAPELVRRVYTDLNGSMIVALCALHRASLDARWLVEARRTLLALEQTTRRGHGFVHEQGDTSGVYYLSDQVEMASAYAALAEAAFEPSLRARADATLDFVQRTFADAEQGGFFSHLEPGAAVGVFAERRKPFEQNARLATLLLERAHAQDVEPEVARRALEALASPAQIAAQGRQIGAYLLALERVLGPYVMFSVVGHAQDPRTRALQQAAYAAYVPQGMLTFSEPEQSRYPYPGQPALYLCSQDACSSPVLDPAALPQALAAFLAAEAGVR